ncbi:peptidyl-prolyl cis-trans isomerase [Denitratisoma oestradiolicum]|uniref:Uncharacterized protein n=1 Tax=Denitratisoma oestradiolicum TaxID=311182 RepID=A0A6S6XXE7_9PROT|nr:peptidylprolyl isomerase [Denitratisoma oestradiolicum]TWO81746.1 hypothetical protein CBW56_03300 [Denitratisoma oestradiolicum]CAB1370699.1 conserved protein of unknown function [Denitratisoma oestradiolicum]
MNFLRRLCREPLLWFVLLAIPLFLIGKQAREAPATIYVGRENLVDFIKNNTNSQSIAEEVEEGDIAARLDGLPGAALNTLVADYVTEEALYREAKSLGLDKKDYALRRRLIQQYDAVIRGLITPIEPRPDEAAIAQYFRDHPEKYYREPTTTFAHVYFNAETRGAQQALLDAERLRDRLNHEFLPPERGVLLGDRFLYHSQYVDRARDLIASHFGEEFAAHTAALAPDANRWQGPFRSAYGYHLLLVRAQVVGRNPTLAEVRAEVEQDARAAAVEKSIAAAKAQVVKAYKVELEDSLHRILKGS